MLLPKSKIKIIFAAFLVVLLFSLWFTIERMADRIDRQQTKIESLNKELAEAKKELEAANLEVPQVKRYYEQLQLINQNEKRNFEKNAETAENSACIDDYYMRLNELFGFCSSEK